MSINRIFKESTYFLVVLLIACGILTVSHSTPAVAKLEQLSGQELRDVSGQDGIRLDFPTFGFTSSRIEYRDESGLPVGLGGSGNPGVIAMDNVFVGDDSVLTSTQDQGAPVNNFTIDLTAGNEILFDFPSSPNLSFITSPVLMGDPTQTTQAEIRARQINFDETQVALAGKNDGYDLDINFRMEIEKFTIRDLDGINGTGTPGNFALFNVDIGDPLTPWTSGTADLIGAEADVDPSLDFGGALGTGGGFRVTIPAGTAFGICVCNDGEPGPGGVRPAQNIAFDGWMQNVTVQQDAWVKVGPQ